MVRQRLTLDSPVFKGTLRQSSRGVVYERRTLQPATIDDVVAARIRKHKQLTVPNADQRQSSIANPPHSAQITSPLPSLVTPQPAPDNGTESKFFDTIQLIKLPYHRKQQLLYGMAGIVFAVGLAVSLTGLRTNHQVAAQVEHSQQTSENSGQADSTTPSTIKPSAVMVHNYAVSPNLPRYIDIPKLRVHARTLSEGITKAGELQVPWNIYDTGWYNASSQPGQNGAVLVDGHSGIGKTHGIFWQIASLVAGDPIIITRGDGQKFTYDVVRVQTVGVKGVDMASMLISANTSRPGLNLITCAGDQIPGTTELNKRVQIYAVLQ